MVDGLGRFARLLRIWLPIGFFLVLALFPFYWMAVTSLKPNAELYNTRMMPLLVYHPTLKHYVDLLTETRFLAWTWNTMLVAVVSTAISLVFGGMLAYPPMLVPFCAWLLMGYFKTVPQELEEAARIDGASHWQTMWRIFLPLCTPGFISAGIFAFTLAQNEFLYALIFLTKTSVRTVPIGVIAELIRGDVFYWGQLMAAALLGAIPVALIYSFFVEHYVAGLTAGSVKA